MPHAIHITTLKRMLQSPEPVDLKLWTRSDKSNADTAASRFDMIFTKVREE